MSADLETLANGIHKGERASIAKAITLAEATGRARQRQALALLELLKAENTPSLRIGISGVPGVGKSTFLDGFGSHLTAQGHKVAVLAIDPSSQRTGGSILADKTRMPRLSNNPDALIRPTPSRGTLGGVARSTRQAIRIVEAAGFDIVLVETVGVGQSETVVAELVDLCMVLMLPGAGDEFQGIKRGILEIADLLVVTKADGNNLARAREAARTLEGAIRLLRTDRDPDTLKVLMVSALEGSGIPQVWQACEVFCRAAHQTKAFDARRNRQELAAFDSALGWRFQEVLRDDLDLANTIERERGAVGRGTKSPDAAADNCMALVRRRLGLVEAETGKN